MSAFRSLKQAFARERLVVSNSVKQLTPSVYNDSANNTGKKKASGARVTILSGSGDIAFTEDGTDPTADITTSSGVGTPASALDTILLESYSAIVQFKAIRISSDAVIEVVYFR